MDCICSHRNKKKLKMVIDMKSYDITPVFFFGEATRVFKQVLVSLRAIGQGK